MADKTIGELKKATNLDDDSLLIAEQQGDAVSVSGALFKSFAQAATKGYAESASKDAATAVGAKDAAQSALQGVRDALDNLPEGDTLIINDLTTGGASAALSAEMGKLLGRRPNRTLVDNGYFANPVNQRGKTEYTEEGYTIDRWKKTSSPVISLTYNGLRLQSSVDYHYITQLIEKNLNGRSVTLSALFSDGTLLWGSKNVDENTDEVFAKNGWHFTVYLTGGDTCIRILNSSDGADITIVAIKLELGTTQTLAHQDADGNWVLNEIPDYNEELLKCCMSTADPSDTYANNKMTPAAINALNKAGDTLEGTLELLDGYTRDLRTEFLRWENMTLLRHYVDAEGHYYGLILAPEHGGLLYQVQDGSGKPNYNICHTGNKPSGSYTGNGSATERKIATGGIGSCCLCYGGNNELAIATPSGAFYRSGDNFIYTVSVAFANGVLTIASNSIVNTSSVGYVYQVL